MPTALDCSCPGAAACSQGVAIPAWPYQGAPSQTCPADSQHKAAGSVEGPQAIQILSGTAPCYNPYPGVAHQPCDYRLHSDVKTTVCLNDHQC